MDRTLTVEVGAFGLGSLRGSSRQEAASLARSLMQAIRYYLSEQDSGRGGLAYPSFREENPGGPTVDVEVDIDEASWNAFSVEAARQGVSTDQLAQHAVLYFAADRDRGRLAQRLATELESDT